MPFGLKNAGATYLCALSIILRYHLRKMVECYVDDIAVKSCSRGTHLDELRTVFNIMRAHKLKINPAKLFLGVSSDKFLGFIIAYKGIHLDLDKVKAIQSMQPPRTLKGLRNLQGRLSYIQKFIANLSGRCQLFTRLMKKVFPSYRMKLAKRFSRISKNISPSLRS